MAALCWHAMYKKELLSSTSIAEHLFVRDQVLHGKTLAIGNSCIYQVKMDFETVPFHWVNRLGAQVRRELALRFKSAGHNVSPEEWAILLLLWKKDGQNPSHMSARTVRDPTTMTRLIDSMVRKGFVTRKMDENDRRRSGIWLTPIGIGLEPILVALAKPLIKQGTAGIDPKDMQITLGVLAKMVENLSSET